MRFSTVVAVSAAALASSSVAYPTLGYDHDLAARNEEDLLQLRSLFYDDDGELISREIPNSQGTTTNPQSNPHAAAAPKPTTPKSKNPKPVKKLTAAEKTQLDLSTSRTDYSKAQTEFKHAEADLAAARKMKTQAMGDFGLGNLDSNLGATSQKPSNAPHAPLHPATPKRRSLDMEEILESLAARGFFDEEGDRFARAPTATAPTTTAAAPSSTNTQGKPNNSNKPNSHNPNGKPHPNNTKPKKLSDAERGQLDLSTSRTDYSKAQTEFKKADADLAAARKMRTQAMGDFGLGGLDANLGATHQKPKRRSLDVEEMLESFAARGFFDEEDELFARGPTPTGTSPATPSPTNTQGKPNTSNNSAKPNSHSPNGKFHPNNAKPKKLSDAERGQLDLSASHTNYNKAQTEYKKAEADLAAARKMRTQAMGEYGLGNLDANFGSQQQKSSSHQQPPQGKTTGTATPPKKTTPPTRRELGVEEIMEIIARGYYGDYDEY